MRVDALSAMDAYHYAQLTLLALKSLMMQL